MWGVCSHVSEALLSEGGSWDVLPGSSVLRAGRSICELRLSPLPQLSEPWLRWSEMRTGSSSLEPRLSPQQGQSEKKLRWSEIQWGLVYHCWEAAPSSLGFCWMWVGHWMSLHVLGSRELCPSAMNPDSHLSKGQPQRRLFWSKMQWGDGF